ncbi:MAG: HAMP domain-containing histidine kinase [Planctomycetes bacterium]|nr:HAMP domain-containing histidine kinase [Planctomycetota bacterium]
MSGTPDGDGPCTARRMQLGLLAVLTAIVFAIDLSLPRQVAAGVTYVPIILLAVWLLKPAQTWIVVTLIGVMIVLGFYLSPATGPPWQELLNPLLSAGVISATAMLGIKARQASERRLKAESELHAARERALQTERLAAIGQVVTTLSHECRNSLQRIQTGLELLNLEVKDRPDAVEWTNYIRTAQNELCQLFEDLRNYAGPIKLGAEVSSAADVWRKAWVALSEARMERQAELLEEVNDIDLQCALDSRRMGQVFRNLFENSLAACADPVKIAIRCSPASLHGASALQIQVQDNGPGLSPEQRSRVFDAFYTTKTTGTGLGMAIVKRIVEAHGGTIVVADPKQAGAEFVMVVPRVANGRSG